MGSKPRPSGRGREASAALPVETSLRSSDMVDISETEPDGFCCLPSEFGLPVPRVSPAGKSQSEPTFGALASKQLGAAGSGADPSARHRGVSNVQEARIRSCPRPAWASECIVREPSSVTCAMPWMLDPPSNGESQGELWGGWDSNLEAGAKPLPSGPSGRGGFTQVTSYLRKLKFTHRYSAVSIGSPAYPQEFPCCPPDAALAIGVLQRRGSNARFRQGVASPDCVQRIGSSVFLERTTEVRTRLEPQRRDGHYREPAYSSAFAAGHVRCQVTPEGR
jgi:hypothetical protein